MRGLWLSKPLRLAGEALAAILPAMMEVPPGRLALNFFSASVPFDTEDGRVQLQATFNVSGRREG